MRFTIRDKIRAIIEDRAAYLTHLIEEYPLLLNDWTEKTDQSFHDVAKEYADGDHEIFHDTYSSFLSAFEENEYHEDLFYKAMLIMVYSYYEGAIEFFIRKTKSDDLIEQLCKTNHIELSDEAKKAKDQIYSDIRQLRNHLVHNNLMSSKQINHIERISKKWPEISFSDDDITINGPNFILDSLKKEVLVLEELCDKLGFKHKKVLTNN